MENAKYPFQIDEYYSPGLNSLKRIYTQHPDFNGNTRLIYELLFDHWNAKYEYAFPTVPQLAVESGLSESTVKRCIAVLVKLELIEKKPSQVAQNNVYIVKKPVTSIEQFIDKFPEVEAHMQQRIAKIKEREASDKARLGAKKVAVDSVEDIEW